jgi:hypothetical protein
MGCDRYYLYGKPDVPICFSEDNDDVCCLCTFPHNDRTNLSTERVRALAYLGATVVLLQNDDIAHGFIPDCLPEWIRKDIDSRIKEAKDAV